MYQYLVVMAKTKKIPMCYANILRKSFKIRFKLVSVELAKDQGQWDGGRLNLIMPRSSNK